MIEAFRRQTAFVRACVADVLKPGDTAIDATVGTGEDTVFLAELVGATGTVYGFDIQEAALTQARDKLKNYPAQVTLFHEGHEKLRTVLNGVTGVRAVMFNLGYLPGGDHSKTTTAETTASALAQAAGLLVPGGILTICAYAHPEGQREMRAVSDFVSGLGHDFDAYRFSVVNHAGAPVAFVVLKK